MTREELAARIYSRLAAEVIYDGDPEHPIRPSECFRAADAFLAYAEKEREKGEPKAECSHEWGWSNKNPEPKCQKCGAPKVKEKRKAREVWVEFFSNGQPRGAWSQQSADNSYTLFREILPGDEG